MTNTETKPFTRILRPFGLYFVRLEFDGKRLSITAVDTPLHNGDCRGGCGQHRDPLKTPEAPLAKGWTEGKCLDLFNVWEKWHLNDLQSACEHQQGRGETFMTHPSAACPDCNHRLGHAWLHKNVPPDVLDLLRGLPLADQKPAWV